MQEIIAILVALGVGWMVWSLLSGPEQFRIAVRNGHIKDSGRRPPPRVSDFEEFFQMEFAHVQRLRIKILPPSQQPRTRIRVSGHITAGEKQQIRNFLLTQI